MTAYLGSLARGYVRAAADRDHELDHRLTHALVRMGEGRHGARYDERHVVPCLWGMKLSSFVRTWEWAKAAKFQLNCIQRT